VESNMITAAAFFVCHSSSPPAPPWWWHLAPSYARRSPSSGGSHRIHRTRLQHDTPECCPIDCFPCAAVTYLLAPQRRSRACDKSSHRSQTLPRHYFFGSGTRLTSLQQQGRSWVHRGGQSIAELRSNTFWLAMMLNVAVTAYCPCRSQWQTRNTRDNTAGTNSKYCILFCTIIAPSHDWMACSAFRTPTQKARLGRIMNEQASGYLQTRSTWSL
jgi:hypothetical protein